jgi:hypothetical protein
MAQSVRQRPLIEEAQFRASCIYVGFVAIGGIFLSVLSFPLSASFHQCSILSFILILILSEGQAGEAWEPSHKAVLFWISVGGGGRGHRTEKYVTYVFEASMNQ